MIRPTFHPCTAWLGATLVALLCMVTEGMAQETLIRGFADVTYRASDRDEESGSFGLGQLDLYVSSQISERIRFLSEIVFEYDEGWLVDVERIEVEYTANRYLSVQAGKRHSPIGIWNTEYHHGALMQPTIDRPLMFRFEDEGGALPIHTTGLSISGSNVGTAHLAYDVMVGNGIGSTPTSDNNEAKSVTARLFSQVTPGTRLGGSWYTDHISAGSESLAGGVLTDPLRMNLFEFFGTYSGPQLELMGEYLHARNKGAASTTTSNAFYAYGGLRLGRAVPYVMLESMGLDASDPYFAANDIDQLVVGFRWDLDATAVLKAEVHRLHSTLFGDATEFAIQVAIAY